MTAGLCVCVVLAVLCTSCFGLPLSSQLLKEGQRSVSASSDGKNLSLQVLHRQHPLSLTVTSSPAAVRVFCLYRAALLEADSHTLEESHVQHKRSAPQLKAFPLAEEDADSRANLSELLARLISSRKGV